MCSMRCNNCAIWRNGKTKSTVFAQLNRNWKCLWFRLNAGNPNTTIRLTMFIFLNFIGLNLNNNCTKTKKRKIWWYLHNIQGKKEHRIRKEESGRGRGREKTHAVYKLSESNSIKEIENIFMQIKWTKEIDIVVNVIHWVVAKLMVLCPKFTLFISQ